MTAGCPGQSASTAGLVWYRLKLDEAFDLLDDE